MRRVLVPLLKLSIAAALITWLVVQGKLDFRQLRIFIDDPNALLLNVATWLISATLLGALRWWVLLRGQGLSVPYFRTVCLQLIGFFFNTAMPGAVGGDIVKAIYVVREQKAESKAPAMVTVLLDRVVGLVGLFLMAGVAVVANLELAVGSPAIAGLSSFVGFGCLAVLAGAVVVFFPHREGRDPIALLLRRNLPGFAVVRKMYVAVRSYRHQPKRLAVAVAITVVSQTLALFYGLYITSKLTGFTPDLPTYATIYPIGVLATALPLAPGGMGVGHLAFERLYALVGWTGGSGVFNVIVLGNLALNMLGFIPYIFYRSKLPNAEAAAAGGGVNQMFTEIGR
jgi:uncharacterized protein (TIRG00374 family)